MMFICRTFQLSSVCESWERIMEQAGAKGWCSPSSELCPWATFLFVPAQSVVTTHRDHFLSLVFSRGLMGHSLERCPFWSTCPLQQGHVPPLPTAGRMGGSPPILRGAPCWFLRKRSQNWNCSDSFHPIPSSLPPRPGQCHECAACALCPEGPCAWSCCYHL